MLSDDGNATLKQLLKWEVTGTRLVSNLTVHLYFPADCDVQEIKREMTFIFFRRILFTVFKLQIEQKRFKNSSFAIGNTEKAVCNSPTWYAEMMTEYVKKISADGKYVEPAVLSIATPFSPESSANWLLMKSTFDLGPDVHPSRLFYTLVCPMFDLTSHFIL